MPDLPQTRQSLLIRLKGRSDDAWSEFIAIYERSIFEYARRKGLQEADALDVTQEVLSAVEQKVAGCDREVTFSKFRGWLFRVARNIAVDKIKEQIKLPKSGGSSIGAMLADHPEDLQRASEEFWQDYRRELMHWAADLVKPQVADSTWQAFWMTAMEGRSVEDVCNALEMTSGNVYAAKFRVTHRLQKLVERFDDFDEPSPFLKESQQND